MKRNIKQNSRWFSSHWHAQSLVYVLIQIILLSFTRSRFPKIKAVPKCKHHKYPNRKWNICSVSRTQCMALNTEHGFDVRYIFHANERSIDRLSSKHNCAANSIQKWFTNQCLRDCVLSVDPSLIEAISFSISFYFLFLIVLWPFRQSQVDFRHIWSHTFAHTILECVVDFFKNMLHVPSCCCCCCDSWFIFIGFPNVCVNHLCNICARTDEHTMQKLAQNSATHFRICYLSVRNVPPTHKYEISDFWSCSIENRSDDIKTSTKLL